MEKSFDSSLMIKVMRIQVPEIRFGSCQISRKHRLRKINNHIIADTEKSPRLSDSPRLITETLFSTPNNKLKMQIPIINLANSFNTTLKSSKPKSRLNSRNHCQSPRYDYPKFLIQNQNTSYNHKLYQIFSFSPKKVLTSLQSSQQYTKPKSSNQLQRSINQSLVYSYPKNCKF